MKFFCLLFLAATSLSAQTTAVGQIQEIDVGSNVYTTGMRWYDEFTYEVIVQNGVKTLLWNVEFCQYPPNLSTLLVSDEYKGTCVEDLESEASNYATVQTIYNAFYNQFPNGTDKYGAFAELRMAPAVHPDLTTVQPAAPPNPEAIFLDGLGDSLMAVDMTNFTTVSQVAVPSTAGPLGIRPTTTGSANEVWVANAGYEVSGGAEVSVVNLSTQTLVTNILTPSIPQSATPVGIVFSNDGTVAFEAFGYSSPDSSGNGGALVIFDAVGRTVTSTFLLKDAPEKLLMAPDGSTAYLLSGNGNLTYYDVLSGTADLTVSTYPPGSQFGYPGAVSAVYIHPDGTRLFWNLGVYLVAYDLTKHTVINQFNSGLPTTVGRSFTLSQDGGRAYFSDEQGDVAILDTFFGNVLTSYTITGASGLVYGGPPQVP